MIDLLLQVVYLLLFPGFLFLLVMGLFCEWLDRKLYARMQNRVGPPVLQPVADLVKLITKEDIIPRNADRVLFQYAPIVAFAAVMTPIMAIPIWGPTALYPLQGDLIITLYLLSIPTLALFVIGWSSASLYPLVGGFRAATMVFGYEIPLILACLSAGIIAGSWSVSGITGYLVLHPLVMIALLPGFVIALVALEAKLERSPFDIPHAETEIVGGVLTEYSGKKLALMRLTEDIGLVVGASLIAAVFLGGFIMHDGSILVAGTDLTAAFNFVLYLAKVFIIVFLLSLMRTMFARLRIDQMLSFSWKYLALGGILQLFIAVTFVALLPG
jgi:NADH-quinone oxidoreductase subunit H